MTDPLRTRPGRSVARALVVIPVHDEEDRLGACLDALLRAVTAQAVPCSVVVVLDACRDSSESIARSHLTRWTAGTAPELLTVDVRCAAHARSLGVERLLESIEDPADAVVLSTDADSVVPSTWIADHLRWYQRGATAVAGVVSLIADEDGRRIDRGWRVDYGATLAADGTHPHVHAANLSVRADCYLAAGGFGQAARAEDIDLWVRLRAIGAEPVADNRLVVATSGRLVGRVAGGFARALDRLYGESPADRS